MIGGHKRRDATLRGLLTALTERIDLIVATHSPPCPRSRNGSVANAVFAASRSTMPSISRGGRRTLACRPSARTGGR
jgi:hypothetical protein